MELLLDAEAETVIGHPIAYPGGFPGRDHEHRHTGASTVNHIHEAPMAADISEGEVTVDYGDAGTFVYSEGDALLEVLDVVHEGTNTGSEPELILVVNIGSDEVENSVAVD